MSRPRAVLAGLAASALIAATVSVTVLATGSDDASSAPSAPLTSLAFSMTPACGTDWSAAAEQNGAVVQLGGCDYPPIDIIGGSGVTVTGTAGTIVHSLDVHGAQHLTVSNITVPDWLQIKPANGPGGGALSSDITLTNIATAILLSRNVLGLTMTGGQIGPWIGDSPVIGSYEGLTESDNVTLDHVHVTGIGRHPNAGEHVECLSIQDVNDFHLLDSTVDHCAVYQFAIGGLYGGTKNFLIRGNTFRAPTDGDGFYAGQLVDGNKATMQSAPSTGRFENNVFEQGIYNPTTIGPQTSPPQHSPLVGCGNVKAGSFTAWPSDPAWSAPCPGGGGGGTTTTVPTTTTTPAGCGRPALTSSDPQRASVVLRWAKVQAATGYRLSKNGTQVSTAGASATSAKFGGLPYGVTVLGVTAVCPSGTGASSVRSDEERVTG